MCLFLWCLQGQKKAADYFEQIHAFIGDVLVLRRRINIVIIIEDEVEVARVMKLEWRRCVSIVKRIKMHFITTGNCIFQKKFQHPFEANT